MKFEIDGKRFKQEIDKLLKITTESIKIEADSDKEVVALIAADAERRLEITLNGDFVAVQKSGCASIHRSNIVKAYTLQGAVSIEAEYDIFTIKNGSKERKIKCCSGSKLIFPDFEPQETTRLMDIKSNELIEGMTAIDKFRSKENERKPMLNGININCEHKRVETTNSHMAGTVNFECITYSNESVTVLGAMCSDLKGICGKKSNTMLYMSKVKSKEKTYIKVEFDIDGIEYQYYSAIYERKYLDIEVLLNGLFNNIDFRINVDADELYNIAKEYHMAVKSESAKYKNAIPLILNVGTKAMVSINSSEFMAEDKLEKSCVIENDRPFRKGLNPRYIYETMELFKGGITEAIGSNKETGAILFSNGKYKVVVLPVRLDL